MSSCSFTVVHEKIDSSFFSLFRDSNCLLGNFAINYYHWFHERIKVRPLIHTLDPLMSGHESPRDSKNVLLRVNPAYVLRSYMY